MRAPWRRQQAQRRTGVEAMGIFPTNTARLNRPKKEHTMQPLHEDRTRKTEAFRITNTVMDALAIERSPERTPTRLAIGLALIRFGIRLLNKII